MPGIGHLGVGLAAKRLVPEIPLGALLVASEATDILWGGLALAGIESTERSPWSHSLTTSVALSALSALVAGRVSGSPRTAATVGLVVLSHWALDFVVWKDNLPLLFEGSRKVGLGLYGSNGSEEIKLSLSVVAIEFGLPLVGLAAYLQARGTSRQQKTVVRR